MAKITKSKAYASECNLVCDDCWGVGYGHIMRASYVKLPYSVRPPRPLSYAQLMSLQKVFVVIYRSRRNLIASADTGAWTA